MLCYCPKLCGGYISRSWLVFYATLDFAGYLRAVSTDFQIKGVRSVVGTRSVVSVENTSRNVAAPTQSVEG